MRERPPEAEWWCACGGAGRSVGVGVEDMHGVEDDEDKVDVGTLSERRDSRQVRSYCIRRRLQALLTPH